MRDAEDFNTGGGVNPELVGNYKLHEGVDVELMKKQIEAITMEQTPIEKAIAELSEMLPVLKGKELITLEKSIKHLETLLPYEKTYHRNIAEKAWDAGECYGWSDCYNQYNPHDKLQETFSDKQTYLNQKHPL